MGELTSLAASDRDVMLLVGDLGFSVVEEFAERFPGQFVNVGVAEQNMIGVAAGLAHSGKTVFAYSIGNFATLRCLEQIRNDVCHPGLRVVVVSVGGGLAYGALGSSHHAIEDLAIMRALPGLAVLSPSDPAEAAAATVWAAGHAGPTYLRLGKTGEPLLHPEPPAVDRPICLRPGRDVTFLATGLAVHLAIEAATDLDGRGISAAVWSVPMVKPLDRAEIEAIVAAAPVVITVEEHIRAGGFGAAVAELFLDGRSNLPPFRIVGLDHEQVHGPPFGGRELLLERAGLTVEQLVQSSLDLVGVA